jgi:hypothetical protein
MQRFGWTLRLIGPLLQVLCLVALFAMRDLMDKPVLGLPVVYYIYGGFLLGFLMVIVGIFLSRIDRDDSRSPSN